MLAARTFVHPDSIQTGDQLGAVREDPSAGQSKELPGSPEIS